MDRVRRQLGITKEISDKSTEAVGIGILDSGIYYHPDLKKNIVQVRNFIPKTETAYDRIGHGTHVAGIVAGNGQSLEGKYRGIAPKCPLYIGKILNRKGQGRLENLIAGLEWFYENKELFSLRVINISIGIFDEKELRSQNRNVMEKVLYLEKMCRKLYEAGVLVVAAAGNGGPEWNSISLLADSEFVLAVGCHDGAFRFPNRRMCSEYSGRGSGKGNRVKPDIVAPGTGIVSCSNYGRGYVAKSGTSMATPIVTGAAALAFCVYPDWDAKTCMEAIIDTGMDLGEDTRKQGHGMIHIKGLLSYGEREKNVTEKDY